MRTNEATDFLKGLHTKGIVKFDPSLGLVLTEKAAGTSLESLLQVSAVQASTIGQTFDPLFDTRKRLAGLMKDGVNPEVLRAILRDIEASQALQAETQVTQEQATNAETVVGQLLLQGAEGEPLAGGSVGTEEPASSEPTETSGQDGTNVHLREGVNGGDNPGTSNRTRVSRRTPNADHQSANVGTGGE